MTAAAEVADRNLMRPATGMRLTVFGAGYLGVTHAAAMAELGHDVLVVDTDELKLAKLSAGEVPFFEPGLQELVLRHIGSGRLAFTDSYAEAAVFATVHFIGVGTPQKSGEYGADLRQVDAVVSELAPLLTGPCVVVGKSTVPVGTAMRLGELANIGCFYMVAPLLRRVPPLVIVVVSWVVSVPLDVPRDKRFFFLAGFFFLGHFCKLEGDRFERLLRSRAVLLAIPFASAFAIYSAVYGPFRYQGSLAIFSICGILALARLSLALQHRSWTGPIQYVGRHSIIFYATHFPIIIGVIFLSTRLFGGPLWAIVPLDLTIALLGGLSLSYLAERGPVKYLFQAPDPLARKMLSTAR